MCREERWRYSGNSGQRSAGSAAGHRPGEPAGTSTISAGFRPDAVVGEPRGGGRVSSRIDQIQG